MGGRVAGGEALRALLVDIGLALGFQLAGEVPMRRGAALRAAFRLPDGIGAFADAALQVGLGHSGLLLRCKLAASRRGASITRSPAAATAAAAAAPSPARSAPWPSR